MILLSIFCLGAKRTLNKDANTVMVLVSFCIHNINEILAVLALSTVWC